MGRFIVSCCLMLALVACGGLNPPRTVTLEITGQNPISLSAFNEAPGQQLAAALTYRNATGGTQQNDIQTPWSSTLTLQSGQQVYISAQNKSAVGKLICRILVDGREVQRAETTTSYGVVTCSGSI